MTVRQFYANGGSTLSKSAFVKQAVKQCGCGEKHAVELYAEMKRTDATAPSLDAPSPAKRGMSLDEFRSKFDEAQKIRNTIAGLGKGSKCRIYSNQEFRDLCGVPLNKWAQYSAMKEFDANRIQRARDEVYWTNEETANYVRGLI